MLVTAAVPGDVPQALAGARYAVGGGEVVLEVAGGDVAGQEAAGSPRGEPERAGTGA